MKKRIIDIAKKAGVGHATVDRVLNERGGVKPATAKRVLDAARELGIPRQLPLLYRGGMRLCFILGRRELHISKYLNTAILEIGWPFDGNVVVERQFIDERNPELVADAILNNKANAIVLYGQENELIIDAIAAVTAAGKPVITIISDIPTSPRLSHIGINHYKAGKTSAFLLSKMAPKGTIIVICDDLFYRAHAECASGFADGMEKYSDTKHSFTLIETKNDTSIIYAEIVKLIKTTPVAAIYNAGTSNKDIIQIIEKLSFEHWPIIVGHDLSDTTRQFLIDGKMTVIIDQNPHEQVRKSLQVFASRFGFSSTSKIALEVPFGIYLTDSI